MKNEESRSTWSLLFLKPVSLDFSGAYINEFVVLLLKLVGNGFLDLSQSPSDTLY